MAATSSCNMAGQRPGDQFSSTMVSGEKRKWETIPVFICVQECTFTEPLRNPWQWLSDVEWVHQMSGSRSSKWLYRMERKRNPRRLSSSSRAAMFQFHQWQRSDRQGDPLWQTAAWPSLKAQQGMTQLSDWTLTFSLQNSSAPRNLVGFALPVQQLRWEY